MKTLIGGTIAAALGLIGIGIWWKSLFIVLGGAIPIILLLGGALALYLGYDELKDNWTREEPYEPSKATPVKDEEIEKIDRYKDEITELKEEIKNLKKT
jgi:hypothetical protein